LIVAPGDTIDGGAYHVDSMNPTQVVLTHLATRTQQVLVAPDGPK
jgi:hypothetical protein